MVELIVLVEGVDTVGKSTFVELLHRAAPSARLLKSGPPVTLDADPYVEYEQRLFDPLDLGVPVIADRWHWGERAYGPVLRGHDRLETAGWRHVELYLRAHGAVVVYLHQPMTVVRTRLERRGDDLVQQEHLRALEVGYQWCLRHTILPTICLRDPVLEDAYEVVSFARSAEAHVDRPYHPSYIGQLHEPRALLFGERRGGLPPHHDDRSCFVPRCNTSGYHLLNCLPEDLWGRLGISNALEDEPSTVYRWAGAPPTVALGGEAHQALERAAVPHATVPHPQYIRRFLHRQLPRYGQLIAEVIGTDRNELSWRGESSGVLLEDGTPLPRD